MDPLKVKVSWFRKAAKKPSGKLRQERLLPVETRTANCKRDGKAVVT